MRREIRQLDNETISSEEKEMNKWNHYTCDTCGEVTVARHDDEGVTPFMIGCHAGDQVTEKARVRTCKGMAQSCLFECDQSDTQIPHVIFYRPANPIDAIEAINKEPQANREWYLEHYAKGGALMRFPDDVVSDAEHESNKRA